MNIKDLIKQHLNEAKSHKVADMTITVVPGGSQNHKVVDHNSVEAVKSVIKSLKISPKAIDDRYGARYAVTVKSGGKTALFVVYRDDEDYKGKHSIQVRSVDKKEPEILNKFIAYLEGGERKE